MNMRQCMLEGMMIVALRISIWLEIRVFLLLGKEKKCKGLEEDNIYKVP